MPQSLYIDHALKTYRNGNFYDICDPVVIETQVDIFLNDTKIASLACSPVNLEELAVGFLSSEGLILGSADLLKIESGPHNQIFIYTASKLPPQKTNADRFINTCMSAGGNNDEVLLLDSPVTFRADDLLKLISTLNDTSYTFQKTGGVHSAGLGYKDNLLVRFEDIGRHNAVDKTFGFACINHINLQDKCLVLSGRIAGEILIKAARNHVSLVLSRSAPTLKSVQLADKLGLTIVGFARGDRFNLYTHYERIIV
ncbi:formate dehydrogenase accessory sulfurtransferase FdhD [Syntrophomonas palmitatica]|uniref:formate dehydrogenase accessory sulfurtransferase FdhD n=1 Tax=Syntrophomonas palmitatica TaxID=402877 RepID=UPI0006D1E413|nr:formate dehydrogenase accessory sulfurtransferase FdhD [Syntrophomonas palmitatica]